ncbi:hypothetical protein EVJ58_g7685 [Rhodofomes roseus]|uniref:Ribosomal lysine N-methyltransferase 4 n=1 Tax=Rhodofomes roseus TaxID=34475 RepID=A0A4Y9Y2Q4_9APHY|nr:hypothetical protein EVJ58_g7685 [Rhodofomes roseus]
MRTSSLPSRFGREAWKKFRLDEGWTGLILCMMWEEAQGNTSKWSTYLSSLPSAFDTPMFWSDEDLRELSGTSVVDKIGKEEAEADYREKVAPAIKSRPDLFPEGAYQHHCSLERYHIMGSRILSRSFCVEPWSGEEEHDGAAADGGADADAMDVDSADQNVTDLVDDVEAQADDTLDVGEDDEDDEDSEDSTNVAMVPMADMLNARYGSENVSHVDHVTASALNPVQAKLYYEPIDLRMITTKFIKAGEQIWNTYGDPPNSELLRRYGHVDLVPMPESFGGLGNPADIVEIPGDLAVAAATDDKSASLAERVNCTFVIASGSGLPEDLLSFVRLLLMTSDEWEKANRKGKLPKAKVDLNVLDIIEKTLTKRMQKYPSTLEADEKLLDPANGHSLSLHKKHAIIVRVGEQRILRGAIEQTRATKEAMKLASSSGKGNKRTREATGSDSHGRAKKSKR